MSWILVDQAGDRFMNEYEPYMQDTGHRPFELVDFAAQRHRRLPALLIVDAGGRELYPLSAPTWHDDEVAAQFSSASPRAMDDAILQRFDSLADLADAFGVDAAALEKTVGAWNALVDAAAPDPLGRPLSGRARIAAAPFSAAHVWPIVSNTQGGPAHDERQRILDAFGRPIPNVFEAGEVGSVFGHNYMSGGNLAECFVGGRIAGREAAALALSQGAAA